MTYEEHKKRKLQRMWVLRLYHYLGMVAWRETEYGEARQYLRRLHPLVWFWSVGSWILYSLAYGFIETSKDLKSVWVEETVWW
jgi:hypothetical protein